jgi:hypothetical protein
MRKIQASAREARWKKTTSEQRSELARNLSRIRWAKWRKQKAQARRAAKQSRRQAMHGLRDV